MNSKLELIDDLIYLIGKQYLTFGLPKIDGFETSTRFIFNPIIINGVLTAFCIKIFLCSLIRKKDILKLLADFTYDWDFSFYLNSFIYSIVILAFLIQLIIYSNFKSEKILKIISIEFQTKVVKQNNLKFFKRIKRMIVFWEYLLTYSMVCFQLY